MQTITPRQILLRPSKETLVNEFQGKPLELLRTPALVIDRKVFATNCAGMRERARQWGAAFRAHVKSHKTVEGTRLQLEGTTKAIVVSTVMEAWEVVQSGLVAEGVVNDILYGVPVAVNKIADLSALRDVMMACSGMLRLMVDNIAQVEALEAFEKGRDSPKNWSVFVKIDGGQKRAGIPVISQMFTSLITALLESKAVDIYGFYVHAGNAYGSKSLTSARSFLSEEVEVVNEAAKKAHSIVSFMKRQPHHFMLSVGSTPTAHAASAESRAILKQLLHGDLELHAGNYPMLDLQQQATKLIDRQDISQKVLATVISYYPGRGEGNRDEALIDAGAIAFSKDSGPLGGYGDVIGRSWRLERISQEHGILVRSRDSSDVDKLNVGDIVEIVGQHACLIAAAYPWYYIVDSDVEGGRRVVDVWVPWKGW